MRRKQNKGGRYFVGDDKRSFESLGAAISLAQTLAMREGEGARFYVREIGRHQAVALVEMTGRTLYTWQENPK